MTILLLNLFKTWQYRSWNVQFSQEKLTFPFNCFLVLFLLARSLHLNCSWNHYIYSILYWLSCRKRTKWGCDHALQRVWVCGIWIQDDMPTKDVQHSSLNLTFVNIVQVKNLSRSNSYMKSIKANFRSSSLTVLSIKAYSLQKNMFLFKRSPGNTDFSLVIGIN